MLKFAILLASLLSLDLVQGIAPSTTACSSLKGLLPGKVAFPGSTQYVSDNEHWAGSSSQPSACTVEPSTPQDVATIFGVIQKTRTAWGIKSGGHAFNAGFSSTPGVLISTARFNEIDYDPASSTVRVGSGNIWDDVYDKLIPLGATVVGGRVPGVGVAGFTLGGGYSWMTELHGLALDNVVSYELVTPTGQIFNVTAQSHPDLFFGLKGGGNNFGVVTAFVLKTYAEGLVFAGTTTYAGDIPAVRKAIEDFDANNNDPNAVILPAYNIHGGVLTCIVQFYYHGATAPKGTFDEFIKIPSISTDLQTRTFLDFQKSIGILPPPARTVIQAVPIINYTAPIIDVIVNQTLALASSGLIDPKDPTQFVNLVVEAFHNDLYDHSTGGAYPHSSAHPWTPFLIYIGYNDTSLDARAIAAVDAVADIVQKAAIAEGQSSADAILYNNYAGLGTNVTRLFGANLPTLRTLRAKYDPQNILSLAGGWRF
ncbi:hypothetical protein M422DRAFT_24395 [Sphaerobolus stellatus SS14]|nr:hypothetical protein M422DRAFT_24395 [Sphaerobolus stellatus SS14]